MKFRLSVALLAAQLLAAASQAETPAGASEWLDHDYGAVRLISKSAVLPPDGKVWLGLHFRLEPGWHTYWRTPGDAGLPPAFSFEGSENLKRYDLAWPVPKRASENGQETFVYENEVVLPFLLIARDKFQPLSLKLHVTYAVCSEICIPQEADLQLRLAPGQPQVAPFAPLIDGFLARVPQKAQAAGVKIVSLKNGAEVELRSPRPLQAPQVIVEFPEGYARLLSAAEVPGNRLTARFDLAGANLKPAAQSSQRPNLIFVDGERAFEAAMP